MAADRKEAQSFVGHEVWDVVPISEATNLISCTWVRKWKCKDNQRSIKSRLCCRGFLDKQKSELFKYASTASRLSQKMLISNAALHGWNVESWDVSTAFLRGLTFTQIEQIARDLRVPSPLSTRTVLVQVPGNAWRHLRDFRCHHSGAVSASLGWSPLSETEEGHVRPLRRTSFVAASASASRDEGHGWLSVST